MRKRHSRNLNMDMVPMVPGLYQQNGGGAAKDEKPRQELHPNNPFREPFPVAERRSAGAGGGGGGGDGNGLSREHNKASASPAVSINEQWSMVGQIMQSFQANLPAYQVMSCLYLIPSLYLIVFCASFLRTWLVSTMTNHSPNCRMSRKSWNWKTSLRA